MTQDIQETLFQLFESVRHDPESLPVMPLDGFIVEANPAACSVYGCTYEELVGLHGSVLTHPDYLP